MNATKSHLSGSGCLHVTDPYYRSSIRMFCDHYGNYKDSLYKSIPNSVCMDDNKDILDLLIDRMEIGRKRYGQGIRKDDDTRKFGCEDDSWLEMELQEVLDGMIYTATSILRLRDKKRVKDLRL